MLFFLWRWRSLGTAGLIAFCGLAALSTSAVVYGGSVAAGSYMLVVILGSFFGYVCGAYLSDRLGRRANFILFAVLSAISVICYMQLNLTNTQMLFLGFPLGFYMAAQGSLFIYLALIWFYNRRMRKLDSDLGIDDE